jgi:hypothetical protein
MDSGRKHVWAGRAGLPIGLALAALAVTGWVMPAGDPPGGMRLTLTAAPTGEIDVAPVRRPILRTGPLRPGDSARATAVLTNLTGETRRVQIRIAGAPRELGRTVTVAADVGAHEARSQPLGSAGAWGDGVEIAPGARVRMGLRFSLPARAKGYEDRSADLRMELRSESNR